MKHWQTVYMEFVFFFPFWSFLATLYVFDWNVPEIFQFISYNNGVVGDIVHHILCIWFFFSEDKRVLNFLLQRVGAEILYFGNFLYKEFRLLLNKS